MTKRVVCIVDGNYFVNYGSHSSSNNLQHNGIYVGGLYTFLKSLWSLRDICANLIVVFDDNNARAPFRKALLPTYKDKPPKEDNDKNRIIMANKQFAFEALDPLLPALGIPSIRIEGEEADDVVYILAKILGNDYAVHVATNDEDYVQMVNIGVTVFMYRSQQYVTYDNFKTIYNIAPQMYTLYKALKGDKSDIIPNVPGIGEVNAAKIVNSLQEPTISNLLDWCGDGTADKYHRAVLDNIRIVKRNLQLIDLANCQLDPMFVEKAYLAAQRRAIKDFDIVEDTFSRYNFKTLGKWLAHAREQI